MLDVLIRNALVVDGTGAPAVRGSVGIRDGRIALDVGGDQAQRIIDAGELVVAPGFIDIHTHYDPQLMWMGSASPSTLHGITTVIGGNCGFSIAPLRKDMADYLMRMMSVVEGMPLVSLQNGLEWDWETFEEWLNRFEGRLSINAGFLVGHNALRLAVMGEAAVGEEASPDQIDRMVHLLETCLEHGGLGFSSTQKTVHLDHNGDRVPSCSASARELLALASVLRRFPGTSLEFAAEGLGKPTYAADDVELMTEMSRLAERPINWNTVRIIPSNPDYVELQLKASDYAREHGGRIVGLANPKPFLIRVSLAYGMPFGTLPGWAQTFGLSLPERERALGDPVLRRKLRAVEKASDLRESHQTLVRWPDYVVAEGFSPETKRYEGKKIGTLAREAGCDPFDMLMDIATSDHLRTAFYSPEADNSDEAWRERARIWRDPRVMIGGADSGAHCDHICGSTYATTLLGQQVRERQLLSMEEAVRQLTDLPGRFYGLCERGRIADGWHADLVIFDPTTIDPGRESWTEDLPGGGGRLHAQPAGIEHVFVNGCEVVRSNIPSSAVPGRVLRSGQDTAGVGV